jgi:uncharacterized protein (TIGR03083 family)
MGLQELLQQAETEFAALRAALAGLDEARLTRVELGEWSVREVLAHLSGWHREMIPVLARLARGEKPIPDGVSYEDPDAWNTRFVAAKRGMPAGEVLRELEASHRDFVAAAAAVPDERFAPGRTATKIVDLNGPHHYREHAEEIRAWRARQEA